MKHFQNVLLFALCLFLCFVKHTYGTFQNTVTRHALAKIVIFLIVTLIIFFVQCSGMHKTIHIVFVYIRQEK